MIAQTVPSRKNSFIALDTIWPGTNKLLSAQKPGLPVATYYDGRFHNVGALIVKVTHRCNLDCSYCYEHITKGSDMTLSTFRSLVDRVVASSTRKEILFLFHGGEPTLMSNSWFTEAINYARSRTDLVGMKAVMAVQSNVVALTDDKIRLFRDLDVKLSVSLDGPDGLEHAMRPRADRATRNYKRAIEAGLRPGILMTINHSNFNHFTRICDWLRNDLGALNFKANVVTSVGRGIDLPDLHPEQVFQAYHDILEYMIETKGESVHEDNLSLELLRFFAAPEERVNFPKTLCRDQRCGAGERVIGITPEGNILPCGRFQWDDEEYYLGGLAEVGDADVTSAFNSAVSRFHSLVPENWYDCSSCNARHVCSYGCQAFIVRSRQRANVDCLPTKMRYAYYVDNYDRLLPVIKVIREREAKLKRSLVSASTYNDGGRGGGYSDYDDRGYHDYQDKNYSDQKYYIDKAEYYDYEDKLTDEGEDPK